MNNPANFTKNAVDALNGAISCAAQFGHDHIGTEHILLSMLAIPKYQACVSSDSVSKTSPRRSAT